MSPSSGADPLAGLRGYHLPDPVSWWPPAPGWWWLAGMGLLTGLGGTAWWLRRRRRRAAARAALAELATLRADYARQADAAGFVRGLSRLLRRFALARFPRHQVAGLTGVRWLEFLDRHGGGDRFREGPGRTLAEAPYRASAEIPVEALASLAESWIGRNPERRG